MDTMIDPDPSTRKWDFDRVFRLMLGAGTLVALFVLVRFLADVLIPFAIAVLLAFLLNPIVTALESRLHRRTLSVFLTVFGCGVVAFALLLVLVVVGGNEIASMHDLLMDFVHRSSAEGKPGIGQSFDAFVESQTHPTVHSLLVSIRNEITSPETLATIREFDAVTVVQSAVRFILPRVAGFVSGTLTFLLSLTGLVVILLYLIFLLIDYPIFSQTWRGFLPPRYREDIVGFLDEFQLAMSRYFRGQFIIAMTVGVLFAVGFKLLGLRMGILLGLGVGLLNMVPYLQTLGLIPTLTLGLIRSLESGQPLWLTPLLVLLVFVAVQTIQDALLTPKIMGKTVGLRPVVLLLGIFIWGKLLGFLGLVLAIPLTCMGLAYYRRFVLGDAHAKAINAN